MEALVLASWIVFFLPGLYLTFTRVAQITVKPFNGLITGLREPGFSNVKIGMQAVIHNQFLGFLRDQQSLIQIIGRAARNSASKVILYADKHTESMMKAIAETNRRRQIQLDYNKKHHITPQSIIKAIEEPSIILKDTKHIPRREKERLVLELEVEMRAAAERLDFELAIALRDQLTALQKELGEKKI